MKAVVTGGAGFIGSHLCELLISKGIQVVAVDNLVGGRLKNIEKLVESPLFTFHKKDIRDYEDLVSSFEDVDWVFHLAGLADIVPSIENPRAYYEVNVSGTLNVLEAALKHKAKRFIYAASSSCYGLAKNFPTNENEPIVPEYPYALTKFLGEELVLHWSQVYKLPAISLRLFNVFGPRSRTSGVYGAVFGVFLAQKLSQKPFTVVGDGTQTRDFTFVKDVVNAFYKAALSSKSTQVYNVGSGNHYSINHLVELIGGEVTYISKRPGEPDCTFADTTNIRKDLDWKPLFSFEEGVKELINHIDDFKDAPVWDQESIKDATATWFKYLSKDKETRACL